MSSQLALNLIRKFVICVAWGLAGWLGLLVAWPVLWGICHLIGFTATILFFASIATFLWWLYEHENS